MYGLVIGITIFTCVLLILIVLVQNPKGGGLSSSFSSSNQFMGVKRTADFIEKATWGLAGAVIFLSVIATMLPRDEGNMPQSKIQERIDENTANPPGTMLPSYPTAPADQPADEQPQD